MQTWRVLAALVVAVPGSMSFVDAKAAELVRRFLASSRFAVVGATNRREKFGNKVLRCYQQHGKSAVPVHPALAQIEGLQACRSLADVPAPLRDDMAVSIITSPAVTLDVVRQAQQLGLSKLWLQPGAENGEVLQLAESLGLQLIYGGPCVLVEFGYNDSWAPPASAAAAAAQDG